jgi:hypothetical protein
MLAFVKTTNGQFPNRNFYDAWKGLQELQYEVITFEDAEMQEPSFWLSCTRGTPVFAGVQVFEEVIAKLGLPVPAIDTYPKELHQFLQRKFTISTFGEVHQQWLKNPTVQFIKPIHQKRFTGRLLRSSLDWIPLTNVAEHEAVYVFEPTEFISEFRIYIRTGNIIAGKHYTGDWTQVPDLRIIKQAIKCFDAAAPIAYALDFGVTKQGQTQLIEFNDATSLGNYGLHCSQYADMLTARWFEICQ